MVEYFANILNFYDGEVFRKMCNMLSFVDLKHPITIYAFFAQMSDFICKCANVSANFKNSFTKEVQAKNNSLTWGENKY